MLRYHRHGHLQQLCQPLALLPRSSTETTITITISPTRRPVIIQNLDLLTKLDVLDLHSNLITKVEALDSLTELRVLNLAGNIHLRLR